MNTIKKLIIRYSLIAMGAFTFALSSCSDDMPEESFYTFTGEMLSDFLQNNENYSDFAGIVTKAGKMDLLSAYGTYTCFAPTNEAVRTYLSSIGLSSIDQLSAADCDTITRNLIIDVIYSTSDLDEMNGFISKTNLLGRNMSLEKIAITDEKGDTINTTYCINRSGNIIISLANDSVENGIVHPVDGLISTSNETLPTIMKRDENISTFNLCLALTGLDKKMTDIEDASWNPRYWREEKKLERTYQSGQKTQMDYCHVPEKRLFGYTAFAITDEYLKDIYGIEKNDWKAMWKYAVGIYMPDQTASALEDSPIYGTSEDALKDERNPLYRLIAYHLLNRKGIYDKLYTNCTIYHVEINPMEWYETMAPHTTLKVEYVWGTNQFRGDSEINTLYLNRIYDPERDPDGKLTQRGAIVKQNVAEGLTQVAVNGVYYYIDRMIDFGETTQQTVFNDRMRVDFYTLWPELMNNDLRTTKTWGGTSDVSDPSPNAIAPNYIFPPGYLSNVEMDEDGNFFLQNSRNTFWSYEGDEFNLRSDNNSYDITFQLPPLPTGMYQIRLGFTAMEYRGIAQFYVDGKPQGIPLDMRKVDAAAFRARIGGWVAYDDLKGDKLEQVKKDMHNLGWYHGPHSVRNITNGEGYLKDDKRLTVSGSSSFANNDGIVRKVIYTGPLDNSVTHTMRIRSVMAIGGAQLMLDYLEFVPKSVYGIEGDGKGENQY
ncbi:MAG: fasciclin domain-containing protein [Bacteroidaceae bacterium]|nr:fasciclin domain-containing protein [Bacteroidaceae bacterium]